MRPRRDVAPLKMSVVLLEGALVLLEREVVLLERGVVLLEKAVVLLGSCTAPWTPGQWSNVPLNSRNRSTRAGLADCHANIFYWRLIGGVFPPLQAGGEVSSLGFPSSSAGQQFRFLLPDCLHRIYFSY